MPTYRKYTVMKLKKEKVTKSIPDCSKLFANMIFIVGFSLLKNTLNGPNQGVKV